MKKWRMYLDALHDVNVAEALQKQTMSSLFYVDEEISIQIEFSSFVFVHVSIFQRRINLGFQIF